MITFPRLPNAPNAYDREYFEQVYKIINSSFIALNIGLSNGAANDYSLLPTTGYNLRVGQLYIDAGFVKVVLYGVIYVTSFSLTSSLGTVVAS
jgi:hypothetical protein